MADKNNKKHRKLSRTSAMHYFKLVFRSVLFVSALVLYIYNRVHGIGPIYDSASNIPGLLQVIWLVFMVEMVLRMFPASIESMGCQKVFVRNYKPVNVCAGCVKAECNAPEYLAKEKTVTENIAAENVAVENVAADNIAVDRKKFAHIHKGVGISVLAWFGLNGAIGVLYWTGIIDEGILFLICLAYSVCDMICILFFCPFQSWFMKNRCCTTCRIYNWDFAMMFTPLVFTKRFFTWSLLLVALIILVQWEVTVYRHPERFSDETNESLTCKNCTEKLCHHKTQLRSLWKRWNIRLK